MAPVVPRGPYPPGPYPEPEAVQDKKGITDGYVGTEPITKPVDRDRVQEWDRVAVELIRLTEQLREIPIDQLFDYRPIKAQLDKLEALIATRPKEKKPMNRHEAQTRFGRVYGSAGEDIPAILTKEEWEVIKNKVKDAHADDPTPTPNDGRSDDDLYQELLTENALEKKATSEDDLYEEMKAEEAMEKKATSEDDWYRKALSADPHEWPGTIPCGPGPGIQPDKPWPRVEQPRTACDSDEEAVVVEAPRYEGSYEVHLKRYGKVQDHRKKERWSKVLTFFCKAIIVSIGIFYGIIIMEYIFADRPVTIYLNTVLGLQ